MISLMKSFNGIINDINDNDFYHFYIILIINDIISVSFIINDIISISF